MNTEQWIAYGKLGKAKGLQGQLYLRPFNKDTTNLQSITIMLCKPSNQQLHVEYCRKINQGIIVKFKDCNDRNKAQTLTGQEVFIDRSVWETPNPDEWYVVDLIGCTFISQQFTGSVIDVLTYPQGNNLLISFEYNHQHGELEIPVNEQFITDIDLDNQKIQAHLPEGIMDIVQWK